MFVINDYEYDDNYGDDDDDNVTLGDTCWEMIVSTRMSVVFKGNVSVGKTKNKKIIVELTSPGPASLTEEGGLIACVYSLDKRIIKLQTLFGIQSTWRANKLERGLNNR